MNMWCHVIKQCGLCISSHAWNSIKLFLFSPQNRNIEFPGPGSNSRAQSLQTGGIPYPWWQICQFILYSWYWKHFSAWEKISICSIHCLWNYRRWYLTFILYEYSIHTVIYFFVQIYLIHDESLSLLTMLRKEPNFQFGQKIMFELES